MNRTTVQMCLSVVLIAMAGPRAHAQPPTIAAIEEKQAAVESELRIALLQEQQQAAETGDQPQPPAADSSRGDLLKQIEVVVAQQVSAAKTLEDVQATQAALQTSLTRLSDGILDQQPPYSILLLDRLRDSLRNSKARQESAEASLLAARQSAETSKKTAADRDRTLRQTQESFADPTANEVVTARLEQKLAEELLVLRRQELAIAEANHAIGQLQVKIDERTVDIIGDQVSFDRATLDEKIGELKNKESSLKGRVSALELEIQFAERRWLAARQEADSASQANGELLARVDALKFAQVTLETEQNLTNQRLQRLPQLRNSWERRFLVVTDQVSREQRAQWLKEADEIVDQLARERRTRELKIEELRASLANVDTTIETTIDDDGVKRWLQSKHDSLNKQIELYSNSLLSIDSSIQTMQRLVVQIEGEPGRTFAEWLADGWGQAKQIWNYEFARSDDVSLTVGKVCSVLLLLFFGYFAASWISGLLGRRLPKWGVDEAGVQAIESLSFYVLLIAFGLTALRYANVPLTVFTFLGGAIAIGIGFGSQNILNNFISGLILLAERPIKVGDLILIDETYGNVTRIGARSTSIRTGENRDIVVPNSKFLENNVTNLTRKDDRLRTSITVGVAYGSNLDAVLRLLSRAASEQSGVLERPKPMVWFNDFGDNSLVFQVHFWVQARNMTQMRMIETGVRLRIDAFFREAKIVIAFPQRDLHIQSDKPLDLRILPADPAPDRDLDNAA